MSDLTLEITRDMKASASAIFRCWSEAELLRQWWCPLPYTTPNARIDMRPGGEFWQLMRSPEGEEFGHGGIILEVEPNRKIVFTDAFTSAWVPSQKAFIVATITLTTLGEGLTRYHASVAHWSAEDCESHKARGFHEGWGAAAAQLEALAARL